MSEYKYWCSDCKGYVKENHRCQQWGTVYRIPAEALGSESAELEEALELLEKWSIQNNCIDDPECGCHYCRTARFLAKHKDKQNA